MSARSRRQIDAANPRAFERIAAEFAVTVGPGDAVGLSGPLGAGKTTFVRGVVKALHGSDTATSPTFTFWHRYAGTPPVNHIDLYRVGDPTEAAELGLHEAFDRNSLTLVEYPERLPGLLPQSAVWITIQGCGDGPRTLKFH